jgi:cell division protein FtsQ
MRDLKSQKSAKVKGNRRKREKEQRDWKKFFRRALRISVCVGSVALMLSGGILAARLLFDSGYFCIDSVRVENQQRVSQEEILALSDIQLGANIFDLDLEMIGRKIEENSWIASARVERVFPSEVVIRVTERVPRAVISLGYLYYVDGGGEIFRLLGPEDNLDYPVVTGLDRCFLLENPAQARRLLTDAMELISELAVRSEFNLNDVSELHIDRTDGFDLYTYVGGVPIRMGYSKFSSKLNRLESIYKGLEQRLLVLKYIDLNVEDRIIVKIGTKRGYGNG